MLKLPKSLPGGKTAQEHPLSWGALSDRLLCALLKRGDQSALRASRPEQQQPQLWHIPCWRQQHSVKGRVCCDGRRSLMGFRREMPLWCSVVSWIKCPPKGKIKANGCGLGGAIDAVYKVNALLFTQNKVCEAAFGSPAL